MGIICLGILFLGICFGELKEENLISNGGFEEGELKVVPDGGGVFGRKNLGNFIPQLIQKKGIVEKEQ